MSAPLRTLVVAPNWIGDAVMAQPLMAALRRQAQPQAIEVLSPPHIAPVFRAMRETDAVLEAANTHGKLELGARWRLARMLRARRYDRAIVLPNSAKSALVPWLARIPKRTGYRGEARRLLLNRIHEDRSAQAAPDRRRPMVEHYAQLALEPGQSLQGRVADPRLSRDREAELAVRERFQLPADTPLIVLCPGAEYGPAKRWPVRHFASLSLLIDSEWPQAEIVLLGSAKERPLATEITALSGLALRNLSGETSIAEAMAVISQAAGVISNDSGLMHVAAAYGRPQVAIFGSSDPRHTPPRSPRARVEWLHLDCSPCFERECPLGHLNCLNMIEPERVMQALRSALRVEAADGPRET
ncbi:MAG: lipopolysaccharide heptosyltransferase II [Limnobacter sp.]|nr:lipopolysaccharide heptosyltransferase II [Limnobacter sp.]